MNRCTVICIAFFFLSLSASAQDVGSTYQTAVGVKFGWWDGLAVSVKHFISDNVALEAQASFYRYGGEGTGLYEYYGNIPSVEGLKWYAGVGGHLGSYNTTYAHNYESRSSGVYFGPDAILGVDYKFTGAPIDLSFDIQPRVDVPGPYFNLWGGLGVRFAF